MQGEIDGLAMQFNSPEEAAVGKQALGSDGPLFPTVYTSRLPVCCLLPTANSTSDCTTKRSLRSNAD
jgi:hypothetical protein